MVTTWSLAIFYLIVVIGPFFYVGTLLFGCLTTAEKTKKLQQNKLKAKRKKGPVTPSDKNKEVVLSLHGEITEEDLNMPDLSNKSTAIKSKGSDEILLEEMKVQDAKPEPPVHKKTKRSTLEKMPDSKNRKPENIFYGSK
ncbi:hypothetical protein M3Y96_00239600 [Aphelenchoides besseyi]|nr:hypothetical protein M3Y96_00239600 [Aphelenchoides besseyi]